MRKYILCASSPLRIWTIDTSTNTATGTAPLNQEHMDIQDKTWPFTFVADTPRDLVYHINGGASVTEIDVSNPKAPTVTQLKTNKGVNLMSAALAGGFGQPSHVDQRLYAGGSDGFIYTFPLDSSGKTRKTTSDPAPYEVLEAHNRPIIDLAITSDGTHAFALIQSNDGKAAAVTKDLKPMPHNPQSHYYADRPQWDTIPNPTSISLTPDERYLIVTANNSNMCTIIDTKTTESHQRHLATDPVFAPRPVRVDDSTAYFNSLGEFHKIDLASGEAKSEVNPGLAGVVGTGDKHVLLTLTAQYKEGTDYLSCVLFTYDGKERVDMPAMNFGPAERIWLLIGTNLLLEV
ncbi:hypothetical protein [Streptomyces syringium]|uniref:WD40 repeat protein n=1 Tax=Streptomyces syringium TaxID=76729 RepID=A0ABS4XX11_9ACTN|nr:hypothetical protein [Streptomyces syringium]MBP2400797.1 WD40 repeat protein [Streptomyces syringium]